MVKNNIVNFPVKIHFPGCKCKYYNSKIKNGDEILISPYNKCYFKERYYRYKTFEDFVNDKRMFPNNCLCTYKDGIYNGGVVIITNTPNILPISNSDELYSVRFELFANIKHEQDNSHLINNFCKLFSCLDDYYTIIGNTIGSEINNCTFPKGKISLEDANNEECCYREFAEETGCILPDCLISSETQMNKRKIYDLEFIPLDIVIDNFLLKIIII